MPDTGLSKLKTQRAVFTHLACKLGCEKTNYTRGYLSHYNSRKCVPFFLREKETCPSGMKFLMGGPMNEERA